MKRSAPEPGLSKLKRTDFEYDIGRLLTDLWLVFIETKIKEK